MSDVRLQRLHTAASILFKVTKSQLMAPKPALRGDKESEEPTAPVPAGHRGFRTHRLYLHMHNIQKMGP